VLARQQCPVTAVPLKGPDDPVGDEQIDPPRRIVIPRVDAIDVSGHPTSERVETWLAQLPQLTSRPARTRRWGWSIVALVEVVAGMHRREVLEGHGHGGGVRIETAIDLDRRNVRNLDLVLGRLREEQRAIVLNLRKNVAGDRGPRYRSVLPNEAA